MMSAANNCLPWHLWGGYPSVGSATLQHVLPGGGGRILFFSPRPSSTSPPPSPAPCAPQICPYRAYCRASGTSAWRFTLMMDRSARRIAIAGHAAAKRLHGSMLVCERTLGLCDTGHDDMNTVKITWRRQLGRDACITPKCRLPGWPVQNGVAPSSAFEKAIENKSLRFVRCTPSLIAFDPALPNTIALRMGMG